MPIQKMPCLIPIHFFSLFLSFYIVQNSPLKPRYPKNFMDASQSLQRFGLLYVVVSCSGFAYPCGKSLSFLQNLRQFGHHENTTMNK